MRPARDPVDTDPLTVPTALIAEDEPLLVEELVDALARLWPELVVIARARNGIDALRLVEEHAPDVVFLDIQMPGCTGLEVAASLTPGRPCVIFCTAFDQHAVTAFELHAVVFLADPVGGHVYSRVVTLCQRGRGRSGMRRHATQNHQKT